MTNFDLLKEAGEKISMNVSRETFEKFEIYRTLLKEWNEKINLTSITDDKEIYIKHFIDSINIYKLEEIRELQKVIDVGTGAGFPGLPMKLINDNIKLTLLDPLNKRLLFLQDVINKAGLNNVTLIHGRAEDVSRETLHRDKYDLAVTRAVASFPIVSEYCIPFVKVGGKFVALKGPGIENEVDLNKGILKELSSKLKKIETVEIDGLQHNLVIVDKIDKTNKKYPRKNALIKKDAEKYREILNEMKGRTQ